MRDHQLMERRSEPLGEGVAGGWPQELLGQSRAVVGSCELLCAFQTVTVNPCCIRKISNYRKVGRIAQRPHYLFPASSVSSMESLLCEGV
ncbi:unnamed protein product [Gulo gulo]|uniref:Uncharacterized protein n=1 Tax=Gulo gulo TaxID=48420 RepID=A0A9X9Q6A0_GULGU|nr:unnamed protein product [Gulo gulo]